MSALASNCPRLVIAGTGSGVGKTSLALGLARSLARRGMRVQTFKVGPDFLDPTYLARASGRTCYNLDGWMTGREYVRHLFARATSDADIAIIEGVMGMFDGASATSLEGSTAEVALWLDAPVLLVADVYGVARSLAALVKGYAQFEPRVRVAGVLANRCGSEQHRAWLAESLRGAGLAPLAGAVPRGALPELRSRHLGLLTADDEAVPAAVLDQLADACERHLEVEAIVRAASSTSAVAADVAERPAPAQQVRIGIACDAAFHFYYADGLERMEREGAELVRFSPLADRSLPDGLGGLYIGGGYPEVHAEALSANRSMLDSVRSFAASGRPVYAECGGLMYLARQLTTSDGRSFPLVGLLPVAGRMLARLQAIGYVEVSLAEDSIWGRRGDTFRGHEFHYSELGGPVPAGSGWQPAYSLRRRSGGPAETEGLQKGHVLASYVHVHFASQPGCIAHFLARCRETA